MCVIRTIVALPIGALFAAVLFLYAKENADIHTSKRSALRLMRPAFNRATTPGEWSRCEDLNPEPDDYKSTALAIAPHRQSARLSGLSGGFRCPANDGQ